MDNVSKVYGSVRAVDQISIDIASGEFVALLGPSGCGKTTTLRMLAGFVRPTDGGIWIDGALVNGIPPERRPVNMVFQNYALFPHMTVAENIAYGPRIQGRSKGETRAAVGQVLQLVRLEGYEDRRVSQLSGGQAQRVALARALINRPKVLLLDEPLGALDLQLRRAMQLELRGIQQRLGITFVYVTHDQEEAMVMADRIVLMDHGRIEQVGPPIELYHRPRSVFASRFLGETNLLDGTLVDVRGNLAVVRIGAATVTALSVAGVAVGDPVALAVRPEQVAIHRTAEPVVRRGDNESQGRVASATFLGSFVRYIIETSDLGPMTADETIRDGTAPSHSVGEPVTVSWAASSGTMLALVPPGSDRVPGPPA